VDYTIVRDLEVSRRQKQMDLLLANEVIEEYRGESAPDLTMTPRAFLVMAALAIETTAWSTIAQVQARLEDQKVDIPIATLYPLVDRLTAGGLLERKEQSGARGRPRGFYRLNHNGCRALSLGHAVAIARTKNKKAEA
jgi:Fe2+ or Zn2+ uptake regulation protein